MRRGLAERLSKGASFRKLGVTSWIALGILALLVLAAVFAPLFATHDPYLTGDAVEGPSGEHWLGTDSSGRDIYTRLVWGARWSLAVGLGAIAIALVAGALIGAVAATSRRRVGEAIMRVLDVVMAFPGVALAAVLVAVFGRGLIVLILALAFLYMPSMARVVRANVLAQYGASETVAYQPFGQAPHSFAVLPPGERHRVVRRPQRDDVAELRDRVLENLAQTGNLSQFGRAEPPGPVDAVSHALSQN